MDRLLVIEDGDEYEQFARLFLAERFETVAVHNAADALSVMEDAPAQALLIDLRFERAANEELVGDVQATAQRLFSGDESRAVRWLKEQQGTLVLKELREAGHDQPAVFVHDFPPRRLQNLRRLYGKVGAVATFDAQAILAEYARLDG